MDNSSPQHSLVSAFDLHHTVNIRYPALELLSRDDTWKMAKPRAITMRFEPNALITDPRVIENTDRNAEEGTRFLHYTKALRGHSEQYSEEEPEKHDIEALLRDMKELSRCIGSTELRAVIYRPANIKPEQRSTCMTIRRISRLKCADGLIKECGTFYVLSAPKFMDLAKTEAGLEIWYCDLRDLVLLNSDRAVRHARDTMQRYPIADEDEDVMGFATGWLPPRLPSLVPVICSKVTQAELQQEVIRDEDASECQICKQPFDHHDIVPVIVNGSCDHMYCHARLTTWVLSNGDQATCPFCRKSFTTPEQYVDLLHGTDAAGRYVYDDRFNTWENFERSCADLDTSRASLLMATPDSKITVNAKLLAEFWDYLVEQARAESETSTPAHHNPANFTELDVATTAISHGLFQIDGATLPPNALCHMLIKDIDAAFFKTFVRSEMASMVDGVVIAMALEEWARADNTMDLRPNLWLFIERTLNRMVNFVRLRRCECVGEIGLHKHGACRMYYNS
ncbi:hypothetical protein CLAFUW4_04348 [Fulvia fulva]|uniref:Anaphase-promoting complex subunit 11 n=1 Tax=Passalora fulva TaxID=5499 RepID=A0A9Q8LI62_PASFU|nr:uncharacterized protein CLAFUR5_04311 [Fulvia fulva]KAK4627332.1 hypothetical protein CLAFUR4_04334 [Fulvia fulva]KAK4627997.1 hypothetical protein CLAFUR0_04336 [Fulvia fulva]UJO17063.1 hypothetical protein CLAFUR5_04311 [Fulvia fulva]WPV13842.1 hypothetical protein CLAFUW4_04348 [Fulvia fulva]WPV28518.1 hypothetical protein CLAFUW7_04337 [Fulvia fulva]